MGGWGSVTPREEGVQGQSPAIRRALRVGRLACPWANNRPSRGVSRCAHRSARRAGRQGASGKRRAAPRRSPRPGSAGHVLASEGRGCATQGTCAGRVVPGTGAAGRGRQPAHHHTGAGCDRAPTERPAQADGLCKAGESHRRSRRKALQRLPGCATAGARPAAALGGGLERGRRLAPTRAPHLWSERSERNRRGAQPRGWEGVGPQAVGCGLLLGSRGHPIPFAVIAQQAPCGRCIGRPAGAKRKRASPCGLALFEVRTLSRAALVGAPLLYHNQPLLSRPAEHAI